MDFEEFREKLMEDLAQDLYENTGAASYPSHNEEHRQGWSVDAIDRNHPSGVPFPEELDECRRMRSGRTCMSGGAVWHDLDDSKHGRFECRTDKVCAFVKRKNILF